MVSASQQRSVRMSVPPARDVAVLRIGRRSVPAQILNESCGGFGMRVDRDTVLSVGQSLVLGWVGGWSQVCVAFLRTEEHGLYVGLERLGDLPMDWPKHNLGGLWIFDRLRIPLPSLGWSPSMTGGLIVCGFALAVVIWGLLPKRDRSPWAFSQTKFTPSSSRTSEAISGFGSSSGSLASSPDHPSGRWAIREIPFGTLKRWGEERIEEAGGLLGDAGSTFSKRLPNGSSDLRRAGEEVGKWGHLLDPASARLPDASILLSAEVEEQLGITPEQREEIVSIVRISNDAAQQVYRNARDGSSPLVRMQVGRVRRAASEQSMAVLTPQQRQQLRALRKD